MSFVPVKRTASPSSKCYFAIERAGGEWGKEGKGKTFLICSLLSYRDSCQILIFEISSLYGLTPEPDLEFKKQNKYKNKTKQKHTMSLETRNQGKRKNVPQVRLGILAQESLYTCVILKGSYSGYLHNNTLLSGLFLTLN